MRGRLSEEEKAGLDRVLSLLGPIFDLAAESPAEAGAGSGTAAAQGGGPVGPEPAALVRGHAMIADLAAAGGAVAPAGTSSRGAGRRLCATWVCYVCCWFAGGRVKECDAGRGLRRRRQVLWGASWHCLQVSSSAFCRWFSMATCLHEHLWPAGMMFALSASHYHYLIRSAPGPPAGCARADAMAHAASQKADELVAPLPPLEAPAGEASSAGPSAAATETGEAAAPPAGGMDAAGALMRAVPEQKEPSPAAVKALKSIQAEGGWGQLGVQQAVSTLAVGCYKVGREWRGSLAEHGTAVQPDW